MYMTFAEIREKYGLSVAVGVVAGVSPVRINGEDLWSSAKVQDVRNNGGYDA